MSNIAERLLLIVTTLRAALGAYGRRLAYPPQSAWIGTTLYAPIPTPEPLPRLAPDLWTLFWNRLGRAQRRFQALYDQWRAGTLKPARIQPKRKRTPRPGTTSPRLPRAFAWVTRRAPECGPSAGMLEMLVHDDETRRFVQDVPRAGRLLRPFCRALGLPPPPYLRLPPRPRQPRPPRPSRLPRSSLNDPSLEWRGWELRAVRASLKKYGRG